MLVKQIFYSLIPIVTVYWTVLTLRKMLNGWWRRYVLLTILLVLNLLITVPSIAWTLGSSWTPIGENAYWALAGISQATIFLFVLQMTDRVGREAKPGNRVSIIRVLTAAALGIAILSVLIHSNAKSVNWMLTRISRDLTFLAAALNMVLWTFLLRIKKRDTLLMTVCAGLGIQCAGDAIGQSMRLLRLGYLQEIGNALMSITSLLTMYIWYRAFTRAQFQPEGPKPGKILNAAEAEAR
ncbi:MAG: hypothetical protein FJW30_26955 [Acidobacteria bacterium]|nr:hypothetical protein [Acidobacteriota bacterium]